MKTQKGRGNPEKKMNDKNKIKKAILGNWSELNCCTLENCRVGCAEREGARERSDPEGWKKKRNEREKERFVEWKYREERGLNKKQCNKWVQTTHTCPNYPSLSFSFSLSFKWKIDCCKSFAQKKDAVSEREMKGRGGGNLHHLPPATDRDQITRECSSSHPHHFAGDPQPSTPPDLPYTLLCLLLKEPLLLPKTSSIKLTFIEYYNEPMKFY